MGGWSSAPSRAMDGSGELGGLETMETLTELGDELTLGDIDGEWWGAVGGSAGGRGRARGGRGYGGARGCACAHLLLTHSPPPGSPVSRGRNRRARSPRRSATLPGAAGFSPARRLGSGRPRGSCSGGASCPEAQRGSRGWAGEPDGSGQRRARGRCLRLAPSEVRLCLPAQAASRRICHSPPGRVGGPGRFPGPGPQAPRPPPPWSSRG